MLERHFLDLPQPSGSFDNVAVTSRNAVDALVRRWPEQARLAHPLFTVGDATAAAAEEAGFARVHSCKGDGHDLVQTLANHARKNASATSTVLYPCVLRPAFDLKSALEEHGITCLPWPLYAMEDATAFAPQVADMLRTSAFDGVLLYSARTARRFAQLLKAEKLRAPSQIFALSQAICEALPDELGSHCIHAQQPNEQALRLLLLQGNH